jgi:DNA-binding transcriptional MerR regulator
VSSIRLYCDEDSQNRALIKALRSRGMEVTSAGEAALLGQSDEAQLSWAHKEGRVLFTHNVADFCRLHEQFLRGGQHHAGIVVAEQGPSVGERMRRLLKLNDARTAEEMRDRLEFLGNWA